MLSAYLSYGHLDVVHPLGHLGDPGVVHILDEGVVLRPERHPTQAKFSSRSGKKKKSAKFSGKIIKEGSDNKKRKLKNDNKMLCKKPQHVK